MKKILFYILIISTMISLSNIIHIQVAQAAANDYVLLEELPRIDGVGGTTMNLDQYIGYIFKFSIAIAAFLAVIMIIYGGFEIMLSEAIPKIQDGKQKIYNALFGLIMVLASYLILSTIDPRLVEINTTIPPIKVCTSSGQANCIDTSEVTRFQSQLANDLSNLSNEARARVLTLEEEIQNRQAQIDILNNTDILTETEQVELARLNNENRIAQSEQITTRAQYTTLRSFSRIADATDNPTHYISGFLGNSAYLDTENQSIVDRNRDLIAHSYETYIERLEQIGDFAGAQRMIEEQLYYENSIREGIETSRSIVNYGDSRTAPRRQVLQTQLNNYEAQLNRIDSGTDTQIFDEQEVIAQNRNIIQRRVAAIRTALGTPTPR